MTLAILLTLTGDPPVRIMRFQEGGCSVSKASLALEKGGLVHLERLAAILRSLTPGELDTLELLLDRQARTTTQRALKELDRGEGIPLEKW